MDKPTLRRAFQERRAALAESFRATASLQICAHVAHLATSRRVRRLAVFHPYRSEVDLRPLVQGHPQWTFYFPRVCSTHPPRLSWGCEPLESGLWGLMEPTHAPHLVPPVSLVLVPGLAFDPQGFRLGYGGGFYDALLNHLPDEILTLGIGFEAQRTSTLPQDPTDMPVHGLVTEAGLQWFTTPPA